MHGRKNVKNWALVGYNKKIKIESAKIRMFRNIFVRSRDRAS
jgi:hypothetical protein